MENLFQDGEWVILEWRDPNGLRGCGFFRVRNDQIVFQRGYFDQLSFFSQPGDCGSRQVSRRISKNSYRERRVRAILRPSKAFLSGSGPCRHRG